MSTANDPTSGHANGTAYALENGPSAPSASRPASSAKGPVAVPPLPQGSALSSLGNGVPGAPAASSPHSRPALAVEESHRAMAGRGAQTGAAQALPSLARVEAPAAAQLSGHVSLESDALARPCGPAAAAAPGTSGGGLSAVPAAAGRDGGAHAGEGSAPAPAGLARLAPLPAEHKATPAGGSADCAAGPRVASESDLPKQSATSAREASLDREHSAQNGTAAWPGAADAKTRGEGHLGGESGPLEVHAGAEAQASAAGSEGLKGAMRSDSSAALPVSVTALAPAFSTDSKPAPAPLGDLGLGFAQGGRGGRSAPAEGAGSVPAPASAPIPVAGARAGVYAEEEESPKEQFRAVLDLVGDDSAALDEPPSLVHATRGSTADEEARIAQELADREAEANAQVLAQQRSRGSSGAGEADPGASGGGGGLDDLEEMRRYSVSLDEVAVSAMAEAEAAMAEAATDSRAAQGALDEFATRTRPFSPPPGSLWPSGRFAPGEGDVEAFEPPEFQGMLYYDGVDSLGRPVVVVNADAVAAKVSRRAACQYMLRQLEPLVAQGPYVLVLLNTGHSHRSNRLPAGWLLTTYRSLSRPFRKHVKRIVLVRPSTGLKALLALLRPFASRKAGRKVVAVESLTGIEAATRGEVAITHLGARFAAAAGRMVSEGGPERAASPPRAACLGASSF